MSKKKNLGVPVRKASPSRVPSKSSPKKAPGFPSTRSREMLADAFERGRRERTEWYENHIRETFIEGEGGTRWFNERIPRHLRDMYPNLAHAIAAYVEGLEHRAQNRVMTSSEEHGRTYQLIAECHRDLADRIDALGIGAKPTKEAVRRTGAKRSGAKPGASRATPKPPRNSTTR